VQQWSWILSKHLQRNKNKRWHDGNVDINWLHLQRWHYGNTAVNGLTVTKLCLEYSVYRFFSSCVTSQLEYMLTNYIRSHYNAAWILLQIHTFICIQTSPSVLWLRVKRLCNGFDCLWTLQQHPAHRKKLFIEKIITTKVVEVSTTYMDSLTAGLGMNYGILV